jgi:hypothetical protein
LGSGFSRNHSRTCLKIVTSCQLRSPRARLFLAATILAKSAWGSRRDDPSARICVKIWPTISRVVGLPRRRRFENVMAAMFDELVPLIRFPLRFGRGLVGLWALTEFKGANRASRSITWRTWPPLQNLCPSAVGTPRSVNATAIACGLVTPSARISAPGRNQRLDVRRRARHHIRLAEIAVVGQHRKPLRPAARLV